MTLRAHEHEGRTHAPDKRPVLITGRRGVLVVDVAGVVWAVWALRVVASLERRRCRTRAEERFTVDTMVRGNLDVYAEVLERWPSRRDRTAGDRAEVAR